MSSARCILFLALGIAQATLSELFLDLTTPQVKHMDQAKTVGCSGGGGVYVTGQPFRPPQLTLALDIETLNRDRFKLGDEVVAEVVLTNTGGKPIFLPWNPDSDVVYGKDCKGFGKPVPPHTLVGSLRLKLLDSRARTGFIGGHELFSLQDNPATYRILSPQQSARIRASGRLDLPQAAANTSALGTANHFKIIAVFDMSDSSMPNPYQTVTSVSQKEVTIAGK